MPFCSQLLIMTIEEVLGVFFLLFFVFFSLWNFLFCVRTVVSTIEQWPVRQVLSQYRYKTVASSPFFFSWDSLFSWRWAKAFCFCILLSVSLQQSTRAFELLLIAVGIYAFQGGSLGFLGLILHFRIFASISCSCLNSAPSGKGWSANGEEEAETARWVIAVKY